jgi:DUF218 domain
MSNKSGSTVVVLARGIGRNGKLSEASMLRAETAVQYWIANSSSIGRIVASGMYSLSMNKQPPANGATEAREIGKYLRNRGIPTIKIIEEDKSQNTLRGIIRVAMMAVDGGWIINRENPLKFVCSEEQFGRVIRPASVAFGVGTDAIENIPSPDESGGLSGFLERGVARLEAAMLVGARPGDIHRVEITDRRIEATIGRLVRGLPGFTGE